jgi:hypothetical protein
VHAFCREGEAPAEPPRRACSRFPSAATWVAKPQEAPSPARARHDGNYPSSPATKHHVFWRIVARARPPGMVFAHHVSCTPDATATSHLRRVRWSRSLRQPQTSVRPQPLLELASVTTSPEQVAPSMTIARSQQPAMRPRRCRRSSFGSPFPCAAAAPQRRLTSSSRSRHGCSPSNT